MTSTSQYNSDKDFNSKPGEQKLNDGSETTASHENEKQNSESSSHSNDEKKERGNFNNRGRGYGRGRGNGRGGNFGNRGRGRNFNNNHNENNFNNNHDNIEIPENASEHLFVKGINYDANEDDLRSTFSKYGEISSCKILKDKLTNKSKGMGFVNFKDKKSAVCAINDADNIICKGRNVQIRYSNDKEGEFKGKKGSSMNKDEGNHNHSNGNRGRGFRGRGRGGFRGNNGSKRDGRNSGDNSWNKNKEDKSEDNNGWGSNDRERSRSKENNNDSW